MRIRYWLFLLGKLGAAVAITAGCFVLLDSFYPGIFGMDLWYTVLAGVIFLLGCGLAQLAFLDQRYRCRVCLRRLRMPVETGSWSRMLQFGRPRLEWICAYGHGRLDVEELQFTGVEIPEWKRNREYWEELCALSEPADKP